MGKNEVDRVDEYVNKWVKISRRTKPIDRSKIARAAEIVYEPYGEKPPSADNLFVFDSPVACWRYISRREAGDDEQAYEALVSSIMFPVIDGCYDAGYMAYCDYVKNVLGRKISAEAEKHLELAEFNFIWTMEGYCVFCEHPEFIDTEVDGSFSNENGPVIRYRDGVSIWYIDGIRVDEQIVLRPETQTIEQLTQETNNDLQSIRISRYGWLRFLKEIGAKCIDEGPNDIEGTYESLYTSEYGTKFIATCVSGKIPVLSVPPSIRTCEEARDFFNGGKKIRVVGRT